MVIAVRDARGEIATQEEMELVCRNWLSQVIHNQGAWAGAADPKIVNVQDITAGDMVPARCFSIAPRGYPKSPAMDPGEDQMGNVGLDLRWNLCPE